MKNLFKRFTIQVYNIGIVSTCILEEGIAAGNICWLKHPYKDRFFADPFLLRRDDDYYYILVEEMCFFEEHGRIVLLHVNKHDFSLEAKINIIDKPFHLSFPFCEEGGDFIIPEAVQSGKCVSYEIDKTTLKVAFETELMATGLIDQALVKKDDDEWIFAGHRGNPSGELYRYKKTQNGQYELQDEPVAKGKEKSRMAGKFFEYKGSIMRPAQNCAKRYGHKTKIMKVTHLDMESYAEEEVIELTSEATPPYNETLHTFNYYGDIALVDGSIDTFYLRNFYYKFKKLFRRYVGKHL